MSDSNASGSGGGAVAGINPLLGATPPETVSFGTAPAEPGSASNLSASEPLYGAPVGDIPDIIDLKAWTSDSGRRVRQSGIYRSLKTLSYILALALGASSVIAGIWSVFILPLLHSSFAARKAITEQQLVNMQDLVKGLKELRSSKIYPAEEPVVDDSMEKSPEDRITLVQPPTSLSLAPTLSTLSTALRVLTSAIKATDTTRTSLMTSLTSYTNELHAHTLRSARIGGLNAALAKEGAGMIGGRGEEWDATRKEVRLIKGMLLNRRAFPTLQPQPQPA